MDLAKKWETFISKLSSDVKYRQEIWSGLWITIKIAVLGLLIGIVIGTLIAAIKVAPKYKLWVRIVDKICVVYTSFFRGTPMMVQLLIAYYVLPGIFGWKGLGNYRELLGTIVFGMNSGAYVSEIMRSGINSVDKGQLEAGRALGLSYGISMIKIVIPQAIKNILPTLGNEFISLIKETSVLSFITITDLYKAFKDIATANTNYEYVIPYLLLGLIYIVLVALISLLIKLLEKLLAKSERRMTTK